MSEATSTPGPNEKNPQPDPLADLQERLAPQLEQATEQLGEINERVKNFIRENPGTTLLGAAFIGFVVGKWASRR